MKQIKTKYDALEKHNMKSYIEDIEIMGKLCSLPKSKKDWIEITRYELMSSANYYEKVFAKYLIDNNIKFIHQAPYVIDGNIYFLDFYLKDYMIAIELDGQYHDGMYQKSKDKYRDKMFNSIKIKTIRINNCEVKDEKQIKMRLSLAGVRTKKTRKEKKAIKNIRNLS